MYIGQVYTKGVAGVVVRPAIGLIKGCAVGVTEVTDCCTRVIQAVFVTLAA